MRNSAILVLLGLLVSGAAHAQAYRWVDDNGVVHYSDRPQPGAEEIELPKADSGRWAPARRQPTPSDIEDGDEDDEATFRYQSLSVASPAAEETLWNIDGVLNVSLALTPALRPGHQLRLYYDGNARTVESTSIRLTEVYRGQHNLQAEVLDAAGTLMIRSVPIRFYVQQTSIL